MTIFDDSQRESGEEQTTLTVDENEIKRLNYEMIMSDLITPDKLYLDLRLFKDYTIGALLSFLYEIRNTRSKSDIETLYRIIINGLPAYQDRKFDDVSHLFPGLGYTNEDIQKRLKDPKWSRYVLHNSPVTPFISTLRSQIEVNVNHSAVSGKKDQIDLVINTYPMTLSDMDRHIVGLYFAQNLKVRVTVIHLDMTKLKLDDVINYDEIYTYYLPELFSHKDIRDAYTTLRFIRKRLYVPRLFGNKYDSKMDTNREAMIIKSRCDVLTLFDYVHPRLCSAVSPEIDNHKK